MNISYKSKLLLLTIFFSNVSMIANRPHVPKLIIKTIKNNSSLPLVLLDRTNKSKPLTIPAQETIKTNFEIKGPKNVVINGSMSEAMAKNAQFIITTLDTTGKIDSKKKSFLNICTVAGGINDGSGFISGTPGSIVMNFFMASCEGGCIMSSGRLKNSSCHSVEINLELFTKEEDVKNKLFIVYGGCEINEQ